MKKLNSNLVSKIVTYGIVGCFAILGQLAADKQTEKSAYRAAANAVCDTLQAHGLIEKMGDGNAGSNQQPPTA